MSGWDREADVVVIGFGGAGCAAALKAHTAGAETIILEKQSREYHPIRTDTAMSGGMFMIVNDVRSSCTYFERCRIDMPIRTVGQCLSRWGSTPQKPVKKAQEQKPEAVEQWLKTEYPDIVKRAKKENAEILWRDETGI